MEALLKKHFPHKEIGWAAIGEKFTRYQLVKTRWFNVYLHQLWAPKWHPKCHNHPWSFVTVLLKGGYMEQEGKCTRWRRPGTILYRSAKHTHNVITIGNVSWSLIFTGPKKHDWGFKPCHFEGPAIPYNEYVLEVQ